MQRPVTGRRALEPDPVVPADERRDVAEAMPPARPEEPTAEVHATDHQGVGAAEPELRRVRRERRVGGVHGGRGLLAESRLPAPEGGDGVVLLDLLVRDRVVRGEREVLGPLDAATEDSEVLVHVLDDHGDPPVDATNLAARVGIAHGDPRRPRPGRERRAERDRVAPRPHHDRRRAGHGVRRVAVRGGRHVSREARRRSAGERPAAGVVGAVRRSGPAVLPEGDRRGQHGDGENEARHESTHDRTLREAVTRPLFLVRHSEPLLP